MVQEEKPNKKVIDAGLFLKQLNLSQQPSTIDTSATEGPKTDPWGTDIQNISLDELIGGNQENQITPQDITDNSPLSIFKYLKQSAIEAKTSVENAQGVIRKNYLSKYRFPISSPIGGGYLWDSKDQMEAFTKFRDEEARLDVANKYLKRAINIPEDKEGSGLKAFQNELHNIASAGLSGAYESIVTATTARGMTDNPNDPVSQTLIDAYGKLQTLTSIASQEIPRYRRVSSIAGSIPYIEQFLLTGGIGTAAEASAAKVGSVLIRKGINKTVANRIIQPIVEGGISMVGRVPLSAATFQYVADESIGDLTVDPETGNMIIDPSTLPKISDAIAKGVYGSAKEIFSESLGGMVSLPISLFPKIIKRAISPQVRKFFKMAGMNGIEGEFYEEMVSQALGGENPFDPEFLKDLLITIPVITTGFSMLSAPSIVRNMKYRSDTKELIDMFGKDRVSKIRNSIENGNIDDQMHIWDEIRGADFDSKDILKLFNYAKSLVQQKTEEALANKLNSRKSGSESTTQTPSPEGPQSQPSIPGLPSSPIDQAGQPLNIGPLNVPQVDIETQVEQNFAPIRDAMDQFRNRETGNLHMYQDQRGQLFYMLEQIDEDTALFISAETVEGQPVEKGIKGLALMQNIKELPYEEWSTNIKNNLRAGLEVTKQAADIEAAKPEPTAENSYNEEWQNAIKNPDTQAAVDQVNNIRDRVVDDMVNGQTFSDEFLQKLEIAKPEGGPVAGESAPGTSPVTDKPAEPKSFPITFGDKKLMPNKAIEQPNGTYLLENAYPTFEEAEKAQKDIEKRFGHKGYKATIESKSTDETNPFADEVHSLRINIKPVAPVTAQKEEKPEIKRESPGKTIRKKRQWRMPKADEARITQDPASFSMAVYQFFLAGGRVKTADLIRYAGIKPGTEEFRRMIWAYSNDGVSLDVINQIPGFETFMTGMEGMDGINAFIDVMQGVNGKNAIRERFDAMVNNQGAPSVDQTPEEVDQQQEYDDEEIYSELPETILANSEILNIFVEFSNESGEIDFNKIGNLMKADPSKFKYFPYQLTDEEFSELSNIINDDEKQRSITDLYKRSGGPEIKAQRDESFGRVAQLESRTGSEIDQGQPGTGTEERTEPQQPESEVTPPDEEPVKERDNILDPELRKQYGLEPLRPTYRGTTLSEWENIQDGKIISSDNMTNTTWVSDKKEYSEEYVKGKDDGVLIEFKPEAIDKSVHESGQINDNTGVRLGKGLTIDDVQRVTNSKGEVIYDASKSSPAVTEVNSPAAIERAQVIVKGISDLEKPEALLNELTLPKEISSFFNSLKKSETSKDIWSIYGKGFAPFNGNKIRDFFGYVNGALNSGYGRNPGVDEKILKDKGFDLSLVEKADPNRIWFKNGVFLSITTGSFKGDNTFYAGTQVSLRDVPYIEVMKMVKSGQLTEEKAYEILEGKSETKKELGTGAKVYFETEKYRVNENTVKGGYLAIIKDNSLSFDFDNLDEALYITKKLAEVYPNGIPDALLINKYIQTLKDEFEAAKPEIDEEEAQTEPKIETARDAAKDLIRVYVLRGDSLDYIKKRQGGAYGTEYHAQIGGYLNGKSLGSNKIIVSQLNGKDISEVFSLEELFNEILDEKKPKTETPSLFAGDMLKPAISKDEETIQQAQKDFYKMISNSSKEEIEKAQTGAGLSAAKFAMRYTSPDKNQDLYNKIYNIYFDYFRDRAEVIPIEAEPKPLTKKQESSKAKELGKAAFEAGLTAVPIHDPALVAMLTGKKSGESVHILKAWSEGWTKANLAAPVPEGKEGELQTEQQKVDTEPTEGEKKAGNYKMGHISIQGMDISIENAKGSSREGVDRSGKPWLTVMNNTYGYFRGTIGRDKDHVDVFIGENLNSPYVYIIDQIDPETGKFDELKVMLGFNSPYDASKAYLSNYTSDWKGLGAIGTMEIGKFKEWLYDGKPKNSPLAYNKPDKLVSHDRMAELRPRMKDKLRGNKPEDIDQVQEASVSYGKFDPEMFAMGAEMAVYHIESGAGSFEEFAKAMISDFGPDIKPFLKSFYNGARDYPGLNNSKMTSYDNVSKINLDDIQIVNNFVKKSDDVQHESGNIEPGSTGADSEIQNNQTSVQPTGGPDRQGVEGDGIGIRTDNPDTETQRFSGTTGNVVPGDLTSLFGQPGDIELHKPETEPVSSKRTSKYSDSTRSSMADKQGGNVQPTRPVDTSVNVPERQESIPDDQIIIGSLESIKRSVPLLFPEQIDDVLKCEKRFYTDVNQGRGMLFTNQTGTGKTFSGLGIIKRTLQKIKQENNRVADILLLVPSDMKIRDWIKDGAKFPIEINALTGIKDKGKAGIRVTTYANFTQNDAIKEVEWDLIVYDESHKMMSDQKGKESGAVMAHRLNANHPRFALEKQKQLNGLWDKEREINKKYHDFWIELTGKYRANEITYDTYKNEEKALFKLRDEATEPIIIKQNQVLPELERKAKEGIERTKVVFLSATPFNSHQTLEYIDQFVINMGSDDSMGGAYNAGSARDMFFVHNFGYRMRYNKLTVPDADVDVPALERAFFDNLVKQGSASGRALTTDFDYSRDFPIVLGEWANTFNEIFDHLNSHTNYKHLSKYVHFKFYNNLYSNQLFENLKSGLVVPRIKEHHKLGRKVVVFHRYVNSGNLPHPFDFSNAYYEYYDRIKKSIVRKNIQDDQKALEELAQFEGLYPNATSLRMDLRNPIEQLKESFGDKVVIFNSKETKSVRRQNIIKFNTPGSGIDLLVIQENAGREGIDLHDTTGEFQRVIMNMALPVSAITALQVEGRINRIGLKSNAIFEYPILGLSVERYHFGNKINNRVGTTENLAMGSKARDLRRSFKDGFLNASMADPSEEQGTGGKAYDAANTIERENPFQMARNFYYTNLKKTSKNKSSEGIDYYATPEPVGFKMMEWSGAERGSHILEPSAGHGAIARFAPDGSNLTAIEPSMDLMSLLTVNAEGRILNSRFEDLDIHNKYDAITMNPPFGTAGKMAGEHLEKAFSHLKQGGRVVALVPAGNSMLKRINKMFEDENGKNPHPDIHERAIIKLPSVTFTRAGTNVVSDIHIFDRVDKDILVSNGMTKEEADRFIQNIEGPITIDLTHINDINTLFDTIESLSMPDKVKVPAKKETQQEKDLKIIDDLMSGRGGLLPSKPTKTVYQDESGAVAEFFIQKHSKTKEDLFTVRLMEQVSPEKFSSFRQLAKSLGGSWSSYRKEGMIPGFLFRSADNAVRFAGMLNRPDEVSESDMVYEDLFGNRTPIQSRFGFDFQAIPEAETEPVKQEKPSAKPKEKQAKPKKSQTQPGEFSLVEIQSRIDDGIKFNGSVTLSSAQDVAFLLKDLQTASRENVIFVGIKKDGTPILHHHSIGGMSGSVIDKEVATWFIKQNDFQKVYMVHNHPSGNLDPSEADYAISKTLKVIMEGGDIEMEFIIIDVDSGQFTIFDPIFENSEQVGMPKTAGETKDYEVHVFDRIAFSKDVTFMDPAYNVVEEVGDNRRPIVKVTGSNTVARFVSAMRLSTGNKLGVLIINRSFKIVGNYFIPLEWSAEKMSYELTALLGKHNANGGVIFYDNSDQKKYSFPYTSDTENKITLIKKTGTLKVLDYLSIPVGPDIDVITTPWAKSGDQYLSRADEGVLEPEMQYKPKAITDLEAKIEDTKKRIIETVKQKEAKKRELSKRINVQGDMFAGSALAGPSVSQGGLFEVQRDASQDNIQRILQPFDNTLARLRDELKGMENRLASAIKELSGQKSLFDEVNDPGVQYWPEVVDGFYSPIEKRIGEFKQEIASVNKWKEIIGKGDEAEYTGVKGWLDGMKPDDRLTKSQISSWMKNNRIEVVEVVKGEKGEAITNVYATERTKGVWDIKDKDKQLSQSKITSIVANSKEEAIQKYLEEVEYKDDTKHSRYQLEGEKTDYKEVLVTMPQQEQRFFESEFTKDGVKYFVGQNPAQSTFSIYTKGADGFADNYIKTDLSLKEAESYTGLSNIEVITEVGRAGQFTSSHFDEANILVHLRMNTRTDSEGKKVLFLEEIQSDWGQKGKKKGFSTGKENYDKLIDDFNKRMSDKYNLESFYPYQRTQKRDELMNVDERAELERLSKLRVENNQVSGVPSAPFVTDTNSWVKLAFKVAMKEAVRSGANKIAWTTGEQQNERYDLSKQLDTLRWIHENNNSWSLMGDKNGRKEFERNVPDNELEDYVGKEIGERMREKTPKRGTGIFSGEQLRIGGKGMIGFYGSPSENKLGIIGNIAKSLTKQEPKVIEIPEPHIRAWLRQKDVPIETRGATDFGTQTIPQHSIDITPELQEEISKGLPMFIKSSEKILTEADKKHISFIKGVIDDLQSRAPNASKVVIIPDDTSVRRILSENGESKRGISQVMKILSDVDSVSWAFRSNDTDKVYFIASRTKADKPFIIETWLHEQIGHKGIDLLFPNKTERDRYLTQLWNDLGEQEIRRGTGDMYPGLSKSDQANEYLAYLTGKLIDGETLTLKERSIWRKILDYFRNIWEKIIGKKVTNYDLARVIHAMLTKVMAPAETIAKTPEQAVSLKLYHGSGHDFNAFSTDKVNTGMNAMYHGWGVYLFDEQSIAKYYANQVASQSEYFQKARKDLKENASLLDKGLFHSKGSSTGLVNWLQDKLNTYSDDPKLSAKYKSVLQYFETNPLPELRHLYMVSMHNGRTPGDWDYMDLYKTVSTDQINKINKTLRAEEGKEINRMTGRMVYKKLSEMLGGDKQASLFLLRSGIDGLKYQTSKIYDDLDGTSYVVFDDSQITIDQHVAFIKAQPDDRMIKTKTDKFLEMFTQKMLSVDKLQKLIKKRGGKITDASNVIMTENLAASAARAKIENFQRDVFSPLLDNISRILKTTETKFKEKAVEKFDEYLRAKHSPERNALMEQETGKEQNADFSTEDAEIIISEYESLLTPEQIDDLWKGINKATDFTLQKYLETGFMDQEGYKRIKAMGYKYYVPLRGWKETFDEIFDYQESQRSGTAYQGMVKAKGRSSESAFVLSYIQSMANTSIVAGEKNKVKQAAAEMVLQNKAMKDLFRFMVVYTIDTGQIDQDGKAITYETVEKPSKDLWDDGKVKVSKSHSHEIRRPKWMSKQHEVQLFMNGQKVVLVFTDPNVANAINNENQYQPELTRWLQQNPGKITRWMSANFTAKNPAFMPVNQIRDLGYAVASHSIKYGTAPQFLGNLRRARRTIIRAVSGKADLKNNTEDQLYEIWRTNGGETGYVHLDDVKDIEKDVIKQLNRSLGLNSKLDRAGQTWLLKKGGKLLEDLAKRSENLSRYATFLTSLENGRSIQQAVYDGKEITVNFNTKGTISGALGSLYGFFNANVQGGVNVIKLAGRNKKKFAYVSAGFMAMGFISALLSSLWSDDDENGDSYYDALGDFVKENNFVIPTGRGFITVPMPFGFRTFFAWGVLAHEVIYGKKTADQALLRGMNSVIESISPVNPTGFMNSKGDLTIRPVVPMFAVPPYDLMVNEDFAQRRLYQQPFTTELEKKIADSQQGLKYVSPYIKGITDEAFKLGGGDTEIKRKKYVDSEGNIKKVPSLLDINPSKVEHLFDSYLGGRFQFWNQVATTATEIIKGAAEASQTGQMKDILDDVKLNTVPVLRRLYQEPWEKPYWNKYYQYREQIEDYIDMKNQYGKKLNTEKWLLLEKQNNMQEKAAIFKKDNDLIVDTYTMAGSKEISKEVSNRLLDQREKYVQELVKKLSYIDSVNNKP